MEMFGPYMKTDAEDGFPKILPSYFPWILGIILPSILYALWEKNVGLISYGCTIQHSIYCHISAYRTERRHDELPVKLQS